MGLKLLISSDLHSRTGATVIALLEGSCLTGSMSQRELHRMHVVQLTLEGRESAFAAQAEIARSWGTEAR